MELAAHACGPPLTDTDKKDKNSTFTLYRRYFRAKFKILTFGTHCDFRRDRTNRTKVGKWRICALRKGDRIDLGFLDSTSDNRREQLKVAHGGCRQVSHTSATDALPPSPRVGGRWRVG